VQTFASSILGRQLDADPDAISEMVQRLASTDKHCLTLHLPAVAGGALLRIRAERLRSSGTDPEQTSRRSAFSRPIWPAETVAPL